MQKATLDPVEIIIPQEVIESAAQSMGAFFEPISKIERYAAAADFLDLSKPEKRAAILQRYVSMEGKKLLEVGSGFGTSLAYWIRSFHIDGYGAEPGGVGFNEGFIASQSLLSANGIDPDRIVDSTGESLPFPDESFDIVYSANVLEHTEDPDRVLMECARVLRPGGILHVEIPNYLSYFEGHYLVFQPPIIFKWMLPVWVRVIFGRDPAFAKTLQTRVNPVWCRRTIKRIERVYPLELISLGEELFLERLAQPFRFEAQTIQGRLAKIISALQNANRGNWIGRLIVALKGHYPIYMTARKR